MNPETYVRETIGALEGLIQGLKSQIEAEPPKASYGDYVRLTQLRLDFGKEFQQVDRRPISVRWVNEETTPEPDPDPSAPWEGDEPLS